VVGTPLRRVYDRMRQALADARRKVALVSAASTSRKFLHDNNLPAICVGMGENYEGRI